MQAMFKSELAKLAGVSSRTFRRYLATRRAILTEMGVSPFARKLPPQAVHYISEDYCIDLPDSVAIKIIYRVVPRYQNPQRVVGFCDSLFASFPRGKALVGGMLLCYFLRAEET